MVRSSLLRSSSVVALAAMLVAGCAATSDYPASSPRYGSIKDDPIDAAPSARPLHRISTSPQPAERRVKSEPAVNDAPSKSAPVDAVPRKAAALIEPAPRLPAETAPVPAVKIIEQPVAQPTAKPEPKPEPKAEPLPEAPKTTAIVTEPAAPQPQRPAVVIKPAEAPARPTTDQRRKAPDAPAPKAEAPKAEAPAVVQKPVDLPPAVPAPLPNPTGTAPAAPVPKVAAPVTPTAPVAPAPAVAPPQAKVDAPTEPKVATLTDDQRAAAVLARADVYMKGGRHLEARTLLEDAAKSNNPRVLTVLAETYDPLALREQYPKLVRTGDPDKAIAFYEQARAKGASNLDARIAALKALAGPKR